MNEGMAVFLNFKDEERDQMNAFIGKMDDLLLSYGIAYSGFRNIYKPISGKHRDHTIYAAANALENTPWLKERLSHISVVHRTNTCSLREIHADNMTRPSPAKLRYYESYYLSSHKLAHKIVVDENLQLRDGYSSYILARKYRIRPDIYKAFTDQPLVKVIRGRHVSPGRKGWRFKSNSIYSWSYLLKKPVVPGDILQVQTKKGTAFVCVSEIDYAAGEEFCGEHLSVLKHTGKRMDV